MGMQRQDGRGKRLGWNRWLWIATAALLVFYARHLLWHTLIQLFSGLLVALAALPLMRVLEKKCTSGVAASLSITGLGIGMSAFFLLLVPPMIRQGRQLFELLPALWDRLSGIVQQGEEWIRHKGLPVDHTLWQQLASGGELVLGKAAPAVFHWLRDTVGDISRWMLAPVLGYYFLLNNMFITYFKNNVIYL